MSAWGDHYVYSWCIIDSQLTPDHSELIHSAPVQDPTLHFCLSVGREPLSHQASGRMSETTPGIAWVILHQTCLVCSPSPHIWLHCHTTQTKYIFIPYAVQWGLPTMYDKTKENSSVLHIILSFECILTFFNIQRFFLRLISMSLLWIRNCCAYTEPMTAD